MKQVFLDNLIGRRMEVLKELDDLPGSVSYVRTKDGSIVPETITRVTEIRGYLIIETNFEHGNWIRTPQGKVFLVKKEEFRK